MSNRPDTDAEYERGSTPVSRAYRALQDDGPPPGLDAHILAKARAAVVDSTTSGLQRRRWRKFAVPVALAASVVMAVSVVLEVGKQAPSKQSIAQQSAPANEKPEAGDASSVVTVQLNDVVQAPPAVLVAPPPEPAAPRAEASALPQNQEAKVLSDDQRFDAVAAVTAARPPPPPPTPSSMAAATPEPSVSGFAAAESESRLQIRQLASNAALAKTAGAVPAEAKSELAEQVQGDPAQWLVAIQALRKAGNTQAADREWLAFRKAWPNYPAPADASSQSSQSK